MRSIPLICLSFLCIPTLSMKTSVRLLSGRRALSTTKDLRERINLNDQLRELCSARQGMLSEVERLLKAGASVDACDSQRDFLLHASCKNGDLPLVELLLTHKAKIDVKTRGSAKTLLHVAVWEGYVDVVKILLDNGAPVDETCLKNATPLCEAALAGHSDIIELLLAAGADVNGSPMNPDDGLSPLHLAAEFDHVDAATVLLTHRANTELADAKGHTPLHTAVRRGNNEVVEALLVHGANVEARTRNRGRTPLHYAVLYSQQEMDSYQRAVLQALLDNRSSLEAMTSQGETPLDLALKEDKLDAAKMIRLSEFINNQ